MLLLPSLPRQGAPGFHPALSIPALSMPRTTGAMSPAEERWSTRCAAWSPAHRCRPRIARKGTAGVGAGVARRKVSWRPRPWRGAWRRRRCGGPTLRLSKRGKTDGPRRGSRRRRRSCNGSCERCSLRAAGEETKTIYYVLWTTVCGDETAL